MPRDYVGSRDIGRSDVVFTGARDLDLWTDQLAGLQSRLNARPAYLVGASSGSRTAYTMALRYPDDARGVFTYLTTGCWRSMRMNLRA